MQKSLVLAIIATGATSVAWADYQEVRELTLAAAGVGTLSIDAGAGSMDVVGVDGASEISVTATIEVPGRSDEKAKERIESNMVLSLDQDDDEARLKAWFENGWGWGDSPYIQLQVRMPADMNLVIDDGSGSIDVSNVRGNVAVDDGSGSLTMDGVGGDVEIDDGSGSITVREAGGDVYINDGSGSIDVRGVTGSVTVDDGSGSIDVSDVEEDLIIVDDGSGGLDFSNIGGRIEKES